MTALFLLSTLEPGEVSMIDAVVRLCFVCGILLVGCGGGGGHPDLDDGNNDAGDHGVVDLGGDDGAHFDLSGTDGNAQLGDLAIVPTPRYAYMITSAIGDEVCAVDNDTGVLRPLAIPHDTVAMNIRGRGTMSPGGNILIDSEIGGSVLASNTVDPTTGLLTLADQATTGGALGLPTFSPDGKTVYVGDLSSLLIRPFSVSAAGKLTAIGTGTAGNALEMVVHPTGRFLYSTSSLDNTIRGYSIGADGSLTALPSFPLMTGTSSEVGAPVVHPNGKFLYVPLDNGGGLAIFAIDSSSGAITPITGSPFAIGYPSAVQFTLDGKYLYVAGGATQIDGYSVDASTGMVTKLTVTMPTIAYSDTLSLHPSGRFLYAWTGDFSSPLTVSYRIGADGSLTETGRVGYGGQQVLFGASGAPVSVSAPSAYVVNSASGGTIAEFTTTPSGTLTALTNPPQVNSGTHALVDPTGKFLYVLGTDGVHAYSIGGLGTGTLAELNGSPYAAPGGASLAMTASGSAIYVPLPATDQLQIFSRALDGTLKASITDTVGSHLNYPTSVGVRPSGGGIWVTNFAGDNIVTASINEFDGSSMYEATISTGTGSEPNSVVFSHDGLHAFVALYGTSQVASYTGFNEDSGATLSAVFNAGTHPVDVAVDGLNRFVYVTDSGLATMAGYHSAIVGFALTPTTAMLTPLSTPSFASAARPFALAADPTGQFLLAACAGVPGMVTGGLSAYTIGATGLLTAIAGEPTVGASPQGVAIAPSWR